MIQVLEHLGQYVPTVTTDRTVRIGDTAEMIEIKEDVFHPIVLL